MLCLHASAVVLVRQVGTEYRPPYPILRCDGGGPPLSTLHPLVIVAVLVLVTGGRET